MSEFQNSRRIRKYLVFKLNDAFYGVPLSKVKEVIGLPQCVEIPNSPSYFLGLINLRGKVITAIDLKQKLGIRSGASPSKRPAVILTECQTATIGCVVDSVSEVLSIDDANVEKPSGSGQEAQTHIRGIAKFSDRNMILLVDLEEAADIASFFHVPHQSSAS